MRPPIVAAGTGCVYPSHSLFPDPPSDQPGAREDNDAFGADLQRSRAIRQDAFFASLDIDIIPDVLTVIGGSRYYRYDEYEKGWLVQTGPNCITQDPCYKLSIDAEHEASRASAAKPT